MNVHAAGDDPTDSESYFAFVNDNTRMDSNGSFEFSLHSRLQSDSFVADSDWITIRTNAHLFQRGAAQIVYDSSVVYRITLYKDTLFPSQVGSYSGRANGNTVSEEFHVEEGSTYYFVITIDEPTDFHLTSYYLEGDGRVYPVTVE